MNKLMPQEIEVWYLIPALRRELSKIFIKEYGLSQKKIAKIFGTSEATISHYTSSKRGAEVKFPKEEAIKIKKAAKEIIEKKKDAFKVVYGLCVEFKKSKTLCKIHKSQDKSFSDKCDVCFAK
jgi:predicted transcriptional regulator